jgi:hypothetical protein
MNAIKALTEPVNVSIFMGFSKRCSEEMFDLMAKANPF